VRYHGAIAIVVSLSNSGNYQWDVTKLIASFIHTFFYHLRGNTW